MRTAAVALASVLFLAGCGGSDEAASTAELTRAAETATAPSAAVDPELVGEWQRETTCAELAAALEAKGLDAGVSEAVAGNGFVPGVEDPSQVDPKEPCKNAVARKHSHFFTADGRFGSRDWNGEDVDDGTYRADGTTLVISKEFPDVTFRYRIDGDTVTFEPQVDYESCSDFRCIWSVSVAYPGKEWTRVEGDATP